MEKELLDFGLTPNEIRVYLFLARNPASLASDIAKRVNVYRPQVYDILQKLISKGLVSFVIQSGRRKYTAASPDKIITEVELKEKELLDRKDKLKRIMPELNKIFESRDNHYNIDVFEGKEGLKSYFEFIIKLGLEGKIKEVLSCGGRGGVFTTLEFHFPHMLEKASKAGFFRKVKFCLIWDSEVKDSPAAKNISKHVDLRFADKNLRLPASWMVLDDYLVIMKSETPTFIVRIKNKEIAELFREQFKVLWASSKN